MASERQRVGEPVVELVVPVERDRPRAGREAPQHHREEGDQHQRRGDGEDLDRVKVGEALRERLPHRERDGGDRQRDDERAQEHHQRPRDAHPELHRGSGPSDLPKLGLARFTHRSVRPWLPGFELVSGAARPRQRAATV